MPDQKPTVVIAMIIRVLHGLFVLYMILTPFFARNHRQRVVYFWVALSVLLHWFSGSTTCIFTIVENKLLGIPNDKSFIYKMILPVYDLTHTINDERFRMIVRFMTVFLWSLNLYFLLITINGFDKISIVKIFLALQ